MTALGKKPWSATFQHFLSLFPSAHRDIAWGRGFEFLDKELQKVVRDAELGRRLADKLIKVWRSDGEEVWVLIHIEVQGQYETGFAERMYTYYYRLHDRYRKPLASLVVLADDRPDWRPSGYHHALWGCEIVLRFPVVKLLDLRTRQDELESDANPFAVITLSHLKAQETATDAVQRYAWKLRLTKSLYQRGYGRQDILELFRFIDWLMELPDGLEEQLWNELKTYEESEQMAYVTSVERIGIRKGMDLGRQEGLQQGEARIIRRQLTSRFGEIPDWAENKLNQALPATLELWSDRVICAETLEDVFRSEEH
jgi:hypothetical protein